MTRQELLQHAASIFDTCTTMLEIKGKDYASEAEAFQGITRIAAELDLPVDKVIHVFLMKHIGAVVKGQSFAEDMSSRRVDAINYLVLGQIWESGKQKGERHDKEAKEDTRTG